MDWSQHTRITKSLDELLGNQPASEFLVLQERERWVVPAQVLVFVAYGAAAWWLDPLRGAALNVALVAVLALKFARRQWILARSGSSVLLVESPRFYAKATRVVSVQQAPILKLGDRGLVTTRFALSGRRFATSSALKNRLIRIVG